MKITSVRYERVVSMGSGTYETQRLAVESVVEAGESPEDVLADLKDWVEIKLGLQTPSTLPRSRGSRKELAQAERRANRRHKFAKGLQDDDEEEDELIPF